MTNDTDKVASKKEAPAPKKPATKAQTSKARYSAGKNHYQIAKEVYDFVNDDTLAKVAAVVNPGSVRSAERYKEVKA